MVANVTCLTVKKLLFANEFNIINKNIYNRHIFLYLSHEATVQQYDFVTLKISLLCFLCSLALMMIKNTLTLKYVFKVNIDYSVT